MLRKLHVEVFKFKMQDSVTSLNWEATFTLARSSRKIVVCKIVNLFAASSILRLIPPQTGQAQNNYTFQLIDCVKRSTKHRYVKKNQEGTLLRN